MIAATRSKVRAIDAPYDGRRRRYGLRWVLVALGIAALVAFCGAISARMFPSGGIGGAVYWLHDTVFLPLKGMVWTRWFPYALVWLVPLGVVAIMALTEYLSKAGPVRGLHARLIQHIAMRPSLQWLLASSLGSRQIDQDTWSASLSRGGIKARRRSGFARRVIRKEQDTLWMKVASAGADNRTPDPRQIAKLLRLTNMRLRLDPSDAMAHLRALEVIAADPALTVGHDFVQTYRRCLEDQKVPGNIAPVLDTLNRLIALQSLDAQMAESQAFELTADFVRTVQAEVQDKVHQPLDLACTALAVFTLAATHRLPDVRGFQRLWLAARLSPTPAGMSDSLAVAETFIFFEMWSMRAEFVEGSGQQGKLMQRALTPTGATGLHRIEAAEHFAWSGGAA